MTWYGTVFINAFDYLVCWNVVQIWRYIYVYVCAMCSVQHGYRGNKSHKWIYLKRCINGPNGLTYVLNIKSQNKCDAHIHIHQSCGPTQSQNHLNVTCNIVTDFKRWKTVHYLIICSFFSFHLSSFPCSFRIFKWFFISPFGSYLRLKIVLNCTGKWVFIYVYVYVLRI